ncbi:DUF456 family protein [Prosthecochloris sp. N3]|uniref:DUF456 family protein n=1 Tax=Prosthecochloris ethylica TaxID=2743976 RepID=A0ABR9XR65_9CHLB|nr:MULTISPECIES: DUF456 family protein [Prosthecochloris]MEC9486765.1 DUF456 family protein [Prosthecochloris sp.]MBF0585509.1 DUF456 family protein [Prosthecochloris ethylica]MBF0636295.1 DUF456 family protein [Prosthecochloris ethylica]NUK46739.1 DUF456 family protein [Prosthecochloris ethylica]RNA64678.1 DUF456 family protein [Prosthecochloris sp. ZM_2]
MDSSLVLWIIAAVLLVTGTAGMVLPALPGIILVYAGLVVAAWAEDFLYVGGGTLALLGVLTLLGYGADALAGAFGAERFGGGRAAVLGAGIGTVIGFFFGLPGMLAGPFLGAVAGEFLSGNHFASAARAGIGAWVGMVAGVVVKAAVLFLLIGIFVFKRLLG